MSEGLNKVMILGNLGTDPELRVVAGGQAVMKMRIATTDTYVDKLNIRQERTEWHTVTVWGKRGEALAKFLSKGARVFVEGSLRTSSYEKDGEKKYRTEIIASNVIFANARGETERTAARSGPGEQARTRPPSITGAVLAQEGAFGEYDDLSSDIPF